MAEVLSYEYSLFIKNILSNEPNEEEKFQIPSQYDNFISIGFNKQETKIIVHARENGHWYRIPEKERPEMWHYIILLTSPEKHEEKSKKTFEIYLRHIYCCNNLAKSLPIS